MKLKGNKSIKKPKFIYLQKGILLLISVASSFGAFKLFILFSNFNHSLDLAFMKMGITSGYVQSMLFVLGCVVTFFCGCLGLLSMLAISLDVYIRDYIKKQEPVNVVKLETDVITNDKYSWNNTLEDYKRILEYFKQDLAGYFLIITDIEITNSLNLLLEDIEVIEKNIDEKDYNKGNLRRLVVSYIPNTIKLLSSYCSLTTMLDTDDVKATRAKLKSTIIKLTDIYANIAKESTENELLAMQVDSEVILQQATMNGLVNIKSPF